MKVKDKQNGLNKAYQKAGDNAYFGAGFFSGIQFSEDYIPVKDNLPSCNNGYVDEMVLVFVKNKNKEDGILLWDLSSFDGESWSKRNNTWEDIIAWRPVFIK
jgi:hypothetical protein